MNFLRLKKWSERQQVLAIILMAGVLIFALWFFLLTPLNNRRQRLQREIDDMQSQLAARNYLFGEEVLQRKLLEEEEYERALCNEWTGTVARLSTIVRRDESNETAVGHIDFKVALFEVRQRLLRRSRQLNISLPHDLGLDDTVTSGEDARKLMLQLRAVERLVDLTLDIKIDKLREITPLTPVVRVFGDASVPFFEEYPVRVQFYGSLENLFDLFRAVLDPGRLFLIRRLRVESAARDKPNLLSVTAVLSSPIFLKTPEDFQAATNAPTPARRARPLGY